MKKLKTLKSLNSKGNNKRINIFLVEDTSDIKTRFFIVQTKTLVDFKTRKILTTENIYSVETFAVLSDLFKYCLNDSEVSNKLIYKELSKINSFHTKTSFQNG